MSIINKRSLFSCIFVLAVSVLTSCGNIEESNSAESDIPEETENITEAHRNTETGENTEFEDITENDTEFLEWSLSEIEENVNGNGFTVSSDDLYNYGEGYGYYLCRESGFYSFYRQGTLTDDLSENGSEITWKVYLLNEPFTDSPRFIPQAGYEPVVIGEGSVYVEKGQYIVIYCSENAHEYGLREEGYTGDSSAKYVCEKGAQTQ